MGAHHDVATIRLLADPRDSDGAALTFDRVVQRIRDAADSIVIHMFVWRNDDIGNQIGREVLAAADRGITVHIIKDLGALMYERIEMNRKSFFNVPISRFQRLMYRARAVTFPDTYVEDNYDDRLGQQLLAHENVSVEWVDHTHTKYYLFDEQAMITGSINIEDRHRGYRDYMVEITGRELVQRLRDHQQGMASHDPKRRLDFVLNEVIDGAQRFHIKPTMRDLMSQAQRTLYIEMAYIGDPDISQKIVEVSRRGVQVTMLFSREANIGNDINYRSLEWICRRAEIDVYLSEKMIHSKLILVDDEVVTLGSANVSVFSMQKAVELDVVVKDHPEFLSTLREVIDERLRDSQKVESLTQLHKYNHVLASLQQLHQWLH